MLLVQCNKALQQTNIQFLEDSPHRSSYILDSLINETISSTEIPSLVAAVITPNNCIYGIQGVTQKGGLENVSLSSKYHLGSNTKAFTAFLALKLVENKTISLNTTIIEVFPEFKGEINEVYSQKTLEDLLSHHAGIQAYTSGLAYFKFDEKKYDEDLHRYEFAKFVLNEKEVELGSYSNAGYAIAALMLEKVTGKKYEELLHVFMEENKLEYCIGFPNKQDIKNPWGHWRMGNPLTALGPDHEYRLKDFMAPAGDISMDILNYSKFVQLNLNGLLGIDQCISSELITYAHFGISGYSLGWGNNIGAESKTSYHDGSTGTFYCHSIILPDEQKSVVIMINSAEANNIKAIYKLRENILALNIK